MDNTLILVLCVEGVGIPCIIMFIHLTKDIWKYKKDKKLALWRVRRVKWYAYQKLREIEDKSCIPDVRVAAQERNSRGRDLLFARIPTWDSIFHYPDLPRNPNPPNFLTFGECSRGFSEAGKIAVCQVLRLSAVKALPSWDAIAAQITSKADTKEGIQPETPLLFLEDTTTQLFEQLGASSPNEAEYLLLLRASSTQVGTYSDHSGGYIDAVKASLYSCSKNRMVWEYEMTGGLPESTKIGAGSRSGEVTTDKMIELFLRAEYEFFKRNQKEKNRH